MRNRLFATLSLVGLLLLSFVATAFAAGEVTPDDGSLLDLARPVFDAVMHGQYWAGAALAVVMLCAVTRRYMPEAWKSGAKGDVIGTALAFGMASAGALGTGLLAQGTNALTMALAIAALKIGAVAVGGYTVLHKLASALVATAWFQEKAPAWLKTGVGFALMMFGSRAIEKAEAAGEAAVAANPAGGANAVTGDPDTF